MYEWFLLHHTKIKWDLQFDQFDTKWAEYSPTDFSVETRWELGGGIMMGFTQTC